MHPAIPKGIRIMASIEKRTSQDGKTTTWRVKWRTGGTREGRWDGETCDELKVARHFRALVEAAGEWRPEGYPKGCRGHQIAADSDLAMTAQPVREPASRTFSQVVEEYLGQLKKPERRQIADYRRLWQQHVESAIVKLPDGRLLVLGTPWY
jgi:hypothetical protein